jgi:hypothetical protein
MACALERATRKEGAQVDAFDGAGRDYRQPGYRTVIVVGVVITILIVLALIAGAWAPGLLEVAEATPRP